MAKNVSRETRIYLALWRRAVAVPFELKLASPKLAAQFRLACYRALSPYRTNGLDPELARASEEVSLAISPLDPCILVFEQKRLRTAADEIASQLGLTDEDLFTAEERGTIERLAEFIQPAAPAAPAMASPLPEQSQSFRTVADRSLIAESSPPAPAFPAPRSTPFYSRD